MAMNPNTAVRVVSRSRRVSLLAALLVLAACGGGNDPDTTAPSVTVVAPAASVSRTVALQANASDDEGVTQVEFRVDGTAIGTDTAAPFTVNWDTGTVADGAYSITAAARDAAGNSTTSAAISVTVSNVRDFPLTLSGREEIPVTRSAASGSGTLTVNLATGAASGSVSVTGFTVAAAHIHDGFAGSNGPIIVGLEQDGADATRWRVPANAALTSAQVDRLLGGALYVNAHSAAFPGGEVRGQILPPGFAVYFADLSGVAEIPEVSSELGGRAAVTLNSATRVASIHATTLGPDGSAQGLPGASAAHLHRAIAGIAGPVVVGLTQDPAQASHWFTDGATLAQIDVDALLAAGTYVNVHTDDFPDGAIRGQVVPPGYAVVVSRMNGEQEAPAPQITPARGTAAATVNTGTGAADIIVNVTGADDAVAAHLHDGFAGLAGPVLIGLEKDSAVTTRWRSNGATMTPAQIDALLDGQYYANVHTPAAPAGLVRGQLLPADVELVTSHLNGAQEAPDPVATTATGRASTTVNLTDRRVTVHVNTTGLDDSIAAHVHREARGVAGGIVFGLTVDPQSAAHWFATQVEVTEQQLADYRAGLWYVNVHTPDHPGGEARAQIELGGVAPLLLDEIQTRVFNTSCATAGCHSGGAGAAAGLDLGTGVSHDHLVDQPSTQVPALMRAAPGDAPASYLIRKLDGGPGIAGLRMPNGLPPLADATVARIRAWINAGALPAPVPPADTTAPTVDLGSVAATLSGTVTLTATASDDVGVTLVRFRVNGTVVGSDATAPYAFDWNSTSAANGAVTIDAQALDAAGNVGTSASTTATVSNTTGPVPYTFTEIQTQIFTMSCALSGCHTGPSPQAGMNLSAGVAYAQIVGVASSEVPSLQRINPGNPSQSYMIQKLEGAPGIQGARMPFGGPFLPQATIDRIRAWVDAGAPNN